MKRGCQTYSIDKKQCAVCLKWFSRGFRAANDFAKAKTCGKACSRRAGHLPQQSKPQLI